MLGIMLSSSPAVAWAAQQDPDGVIQTNRYGRSDSTLGGPRVDTAQSSPANGASAGLLALVERPPPRDAVLQQLAEAPARSVEGIADDLPNPASAGAMENGGATAGVNSGVTSGAGEKAAEGALQTRSMQPRVYTPLDVGLAINGRFLGSISIEVDVQGNGLVDGQRFLSLIEPVVTKETLETLRDAVRGRERVPFEDLNVNDFSLEFSTANLELEAKAGATGLRPTHMALTGSGAVPDPSAYEQPERFSAGANIAVAQGYRHNSTGAAPFRAAIDGIIQWGGFGGLTLITGAEYDEGREGDEWQRTETRLIKDFFGSAIRATAGEFSPLADGFQGGGRLLGVGVERAYSSVRPFQNVRPSGRQEFTLEREASVDVIINGLQRQTIRLAPGRYSLSDFPFATGSNQVQLVVDDITGRRELAVFDLFSGSDLLGDGIVDFGFALGTYEGSRPYEYDGPFIATGYVHKGISDNLTLGMNAQASSDVQQVGGATIWGSRYGLFLLELAASQNHISNKSGFAGSISYRHMFSLREQDDLRITANAETISEHFSDPYQPQRASVDKWRVSSLVQWNAPYRWGLSLGYSASQSRFTGDTRQQVDLGISRTFGRLSVVSNVSFVTDGDEDDVRFGIGLSLPLGGRWSSQARYDSEVGRTDFVLSRYATGDLNDVSGELRVSDDDRTQFISGRLDYIHNRFEGQLVHNRLTDNLGSGSTTDETTLSLRSFVGYAGGRFGIGRPVEDAFIIAPVHSSLKDARVNIRAGDRVVARNGWLGAPVVPIQRSYGVNSFGVEVDPLPVGYDLGSGVMTVFPSLGVGYRIDVGSDASRIAMGVLSGPDGPLVLANGTVEAIDRKDFEPRVLFTNRTGRFVADGLAPGDYRIVINGAEVARFTIPQDSEGVVDVGLLQTR